MVSRARTVVAVALCLAGVSSVRPAHAYLLEPTDPRYALAAERTQRGDYARAASMLSALRDSLGDDGARVLLCTDLPHEARRAFGP